MLEIGTSGAAPGRATTPAGSSRRASGWRRREAGQAAAAELKAEQAVDRHPPARRQAKNKARVAASRSCTRRRSGPKPPRVRCTSPRVALGSKVIEARHLCKSYGDKVLLDDVTFSMPPGGIVGVIGPNGAGKTTLMKMIIDTGRREEPSKIGETVDLAFVEQMREGLKDDVNVWESITDSAGRKIGDLEMNSSAYVARFVLRLDQRRMVDSPPAASEPVNLARMLTREFNVLLLDEPTIDLDVDTIRARRKPSTISRLFVSSSHDRCVPRPRCHRILAFEGDGRSVCSSRATTRRTPPTRTRRRSGRTGHAAQEAGPMTPASPGLLRARRQQLLRAAQDHFAEVSDWQVAAGGRSRRAAVRQYRLECAGEVGWERHQRWWPSASSTRA